jgi:hypothetical protein
LLPYWLGVIELHNNRKYRVEGQDGYFMKLADTVAGVHFVMKVTEHVTPEGHTEYKCFGYARLGGVNIAEWTYWALDAEEAEAEQTKEYLLRELKPLVQIWCYLAENSVKFWLNSGSNSVEIRLNSGSNSVQPGLALAQ